MIRKHFILTGYLTLMRQASELFKIFAFPRQRDKEELFDDTPPGTTAEYHPSGRMQKDVFVKWAQRSVEFSKTTEEKPVLLLFDGHSTHTKH
jgi:hypothetical protein